MTEFDFVGAALDEVRASCPLVHCITNYVTVNDCGMFGCGILGVRAASCTQITLRKCDIYECSYGGISMDDTTGIILKDCTFRDLGGNNIQLYGCSDVTVDGEPIPGDYNGR